MPPGLRLRVMAGHGLRLVHSALPRGSSGWVAASSGGNEGGEGMSPDPRFRAATRSGLQHYKLAMKRENLQPVKRIRTAEALAVAASSGGNEKGKGKPPDLRLRALAGPGL